MTDPSPKQNKWNEVGGVTGSIVLNFDETVDVNAVETAVNVSGDATVAAELTPFNGALGASEGIHVGVAFGGFLLLEFIGDFPFCLAVFLVLVVLEVKLEASKDVHALLLPELLPNNCKIFP